jgi:hypothetical protein
MSLIHGFVIFTLISLFLSLYIYIIRGEYITDMQQGRSINDFLKSKSYKYTPKKKGFIEIIFIRIIIFIKNIIY